MTSYDWGEDWGTIFKIQTDGSGFALLHQFTNSVDGANPNGDLLLSDSTLYGMTPESQFLTIAVVFSLDLSIIVTSPIGGKTWTVGSSYDITWHSIAPFTNVNIDYSTDNGSNWTSVAAGTANDGSYSWIVPNTPSTTCLVRVSDAVDGDPFDTNDAVFTIALPSQLNISGTVTNGTDPIEGVTVSFSGGISAVQTNASGQYSQNVPYNWTGTLTPSKVPYTFSPVERSLNNVTVDQLGQDFTGILQPSTYTISGTITLGSSPLANVIMSGLPGNPVTDPLGFYTTTVSFGWSGTVTPTLAGYNFSPVNRVYTSVIANQTAQDYTALPNFIISGTILAGSSPLAGVVMSGLTGNPTTNASGVYTGTVSSGWSGTVTPTRSGYAFTPNTRTYTNVIANSTNQNYTAVVSVHVDLIGTWDGQGVYYRNTLTGLWLKLATPATLVTAGDLDNDAIDDLIGIWPGQGGVWVKYSQSGSWVQLSSTARDISSGDMNGDGRDDLVATWDGQGVYYKDSISGLWVKMATPATQVTTGDLDGDNKDDLIGIWPSQGGVWVKYSQSGLWAQLSSTAIDIAAGDMNGDGREDLVATWDGQGVYYKDSISGVWVKLATPATLVAAGDLDGDGKADVIGIWPGQGGVWVKYSQSGSWAQLSSTARHIAAGLMRGGAGSSTALFAEPFGGVAAGPENLGYQDMAAAGPGDWYFQCQEEKNLTPQQDVESEMQRVPGPGEYGFQCLEQKNLIPGSEIKRASKDKEQR